MMVIASNSDGGRNDEDEGDGCKNVQQEVRELR